VSDDALTALILENQALSAVLDELTPEDLTRATNCPPWDLQELVVHIGASIRVTDTSFAPAKAGDNHHSAADYYRRPERESSVYRQHNVDRTQELARTVLAATPAAQWFDETSRHTIDNLSRQDPNQVILVPGRGPMRLTEWVITRVISVAAHGLDVAITLGRTPWTTASALLVIRPVFVDLLGTPPPDTLRWDDHAFLVTATGRRALTNQERDLLGPRAERFPLLS